MKKAIAVMNRIFSALLVIILLFAGYVFVTVMRAGKGKVPSLFGYSFLQVATGSMEPTIPTGSLIIVKKTDPDAVKVGDVICFYSSDPMIEGIPNTHRVTGISTENGTTMFTTRGDAGTSDDPYPAHGDRLIGVYVRYYSVGKLPQIMRSKVFFFFVLLVPLCIVISIEFLRVKNLREKKEEPHEQEP